MQELSPHNQLTPLLSSIKSIHVRTSQSAPSSLIYWPEMFSIIVIDWPTTYLCFLTHQQLIHTRRRESLCYYHQLATYLCLHWTTSFWNFSHINYQSPNSRQFCRVCFCTHSPTLFPIPTNLTTLYSKITNNNHIIYH